jgi:hypothetical protein
MRREVKVQDLKFSQWCCWWFTSFVICCGAQSWILRNGNLLYDEQAIPGMLSSALENNQIYFDSISSSLKLMKMFWEKECVSRFKYFWFIVCQNKLLSGMAVLQLCEVGRSHACMPLNWAHVHILHSDLAPTGTCHGVVYSLSFVTSCGSAHVLMRNITSSIFMAHCTSWLERLTVACWT